MILLLLACVSGWPCADDELLDKSGECHADTAALSGDGGSGDNGSGDSGSGDNGSGDTDSGGAGDTGSGDTGSGDTGSGDTDSGGSGDTGSGGSGSGDTGVVAPADDGWPAHFVAPYVDATAYPTVTLGSLPPENGLYRYTLAFIVAAAPTTCDATWGTYFSVDVGPSAWGSSGEYFLYDEIATLRSLGGDVMVSFGGAANTPIEAACTSVADVVTQYERVISTLSLTRIDFDIEGAWVADHASITRRSEAIAALQAAGSPVHVWYTLPVLPTGLTAEGVAVVQDAADHGVRLDGVNVMTMDYGDGAAPSPSGQMGEYGIDAIEAVHDQLAAIFPSRTDAELWAMVGSTPMIGQNDVQSEVFDLDDAAETRSFAEAQGVGMLGYWSLNRDHPCSKDVPWAQSDCNGSTSVGDWAYAGVFAGYGE